MNGCTSRRFDALTKALESEAMCSQTCSMDECRYDESEGCSDDHVISALASAAQPEGRQAKAQNIAMRGLTF